MIAAPRVVHLADVAVSPSRDARARSTAARSFGRPGVQVVPLRARRVVDVERRLAAATRMRRTGTRRSPSVRYTCSERRQLGQRRQTLDRIAIVVSDRFPLTVAVAAFVA